LTVSQEEIKMFVCDMSISIDNMSYEVALNLPINDRDMIVRAHNKKIKKQQT